MSVVAHSDWVIDIGPGAGGAGGEIIACGTPDQVARSSKSQTAPYLAEVLAPPRRDGSVANNAARGNLMTIE